MRRGLLTFIQCCQDKIQHAITIFCIVCFERGLDDISKYEMIFTYPSQHSKIPSLSHYPFLCLFGAGVESLNPGIKERFFSLKIQGKNSPPAWMPCRVLKTSNVGKALSRRGGQVVKLTEMNSSLRLRANGRNNSQQCWEL